MSEGYPRLLGDIGGTHARWAWQPNRDAPLEDVAIVADAGSASLYASAAAYLERGGRQALITDPANIGRALAGATGTWVVPG